MRFFTKNREASYLRTFIFGVEDSLVSTVGLLSGVAAANVPRSTLFLTGIILIFVEAFSMAAGSFLSEKSAETFINRKSKASINSLATALVMFISYFVSGFIPLFPYLVLHNNSAFLLSVCLSLLALFLLGLLSAYITRTNAFFEAIRMMIVGGLAIAVGVSVGALAASF